MNKPLFQAPAEPVNGQASAVRPRAIDSGDWAAAMEEWNGRTTYAQDLIDELRSKEHDVTEANFVHLWTVYKWRRYLHDHGVNPDRSVIGTRDCQGVVRLSFGQFQALVELVAEEARQTLRSAKEAG